MSDNKKGQIDAFQEHQKFIFESLKKSKDNKPEKKCSESDIDVIFTTPESYTSPNSVLRSALFGLVEKVYPHLQAVKIGTGQGLAVGSTANAGGINSLAIGKDASVGIREDGTGQYSTNSIAIGNGAAVTGSTTTHTTPDTSKNSIAIGTNANIYDSDSSIVIGDGARAMRANNSVAIGTNSYVNKQNSTAIGVGANSNHTGSTAIGANSKTDRDNSVSFGSTGNEKQLTNVAAGTQATDA
ncbi:hypothetical protein FF38_12917, partial [Lucilia cuprina]